MIAIPFQKEYQLLMEAIHVLKGTVTPECLCLIVYLLQGFLYDPPFLAVECLQFLCIAYEMGPAVLLGILRLPCECLERGMPVVNVCARMLSKKTESNLMPIVQGYVEYGLSPGG